VSAIRPVIHIMRSSNRWLHCTLAPRLSVWQFEIQADPNIFCASVRYSAIADSRISCS